MSHDVDTSSNGVTWWKRSHCTSFQLSWHKEYSCTINDGVGITRRQFQCQWYNTPHFSCLNLRNAVLPLTMPVPVPVALYDQKSHVASHFNSFNLRNRMVPLTMPWASCDAHASAYHVTWPESHVAPQFDYLHLRNAGVWLMVLLASCDADDRTSGITVPNKSYSNSFWLSWYRKWFCHWKCHLASGDSCQFHCMTKKVIWHLISIVLTWEMHLFHWWCQNWHKLHHMCKKVLLFLFSIALT